MLVVLILLGAAAVVWSLPSYDWRESITSDEDFARIQEHLNGPEW